MFSARTLFGIASGAYAIWLCVLDIQQGHWFWLVLPVLLGAFAVLVHRRAPKNHTGTRAI